MSSKHLFPLCGSIALCLTAIQSAHADSVSATDMVNEGSPIFDNKTTTGSPLTYSRSGSLGSAGVSSSLGLIHVDISSASTPSNSAYVTAGGNWHENYTIFDNFGGTGSGTATFTFQIDGSFTGGNLGVGNKVDYTVATPYDTIVQEGFYDKDGANGAMPAGQIFTVSTSFTYGQPFEISGALSAFADPGRGTGFGSAHLTLRQTGFTVNGGNYTATSATGAGTGQAFATNAAYSGFTLANTIGHLSTASLLGGTASVNRNASFSFVASDGTLPSISDTVSLSGTNSDRVVLQMQYDEAAAIAQFGSETNLYLAWFDPATSTWKNAVAGDSTTASNPLHRAYNPATDFALGNWGIDTVNNTVWAVIDHNSEFTVTSAQAAPEPGSVLLLGLGGLLVSSRRGTRRAV